MHMGCVTLNLFNQGVHRLANPLIGGTHLLQANSPPAVSVTAVEKMTQKMTPEQQGAMQSYNPAVPIIIVAHLVNALSLPFSSLSPLLPSS